MCYFIHYEHTLHGASRSCWNTEMFIPGVNCGHSPSPLPNETPRSLRLGMSTSAPVLHGGRRLRRRSALATCAFDVDVIVRNLCTQAGKNPKIRRQPDVVDPVLGYSNVRTYFVLSSSTAAPQLRTVGDNALAATICHSGSMLGLRGSLCNTG